MVEKGLGRCELGCGRKATEVHTPEFGGHSFLCKGCKMIMESNRSSYEVDATSVEQLQDWVQERNKIAQWYKDNPVE